MFGRGLLTGIIAYLAIHYISHLIAYPITYFTAHFTAHLRPPDRRLTDKRLGERYHGFIQPGLGPDFGSREQWFL